MKKNKILHAFFLIVTLSSISLFLGQTSSAGAENADWDELLAKAKGQTVDWFMWGGSPAVNAYVNGFVAPQLQERYGVTLRQVPVNDIAEVISKLLVEKQAGKHEGGEADLLWINGENFRTAKRNELLYGPFADKLPNQSFVDWNRASVQNDFGEAVEGLESPYGSAQVVLSYNTARIAEPPKSIGDLLEWIRQHPGKFSYPAPPDFTGSAFVRHVFYYAAGDVHSWQGEFDRQKFDEAAKKTYKILRDLVPYLWREGKTYPESPVRLAQLFADGEVEFAIDYNPANASKKIHDGLYPETVRTFVFEEGTIANTHFVAIPFNASDKEAAMVLADFLLSPEAQYQKAVPDVWGDLPAIDPTRLDESWREKFNQLERGVATLSDEILQAHQLPEPSSEILIQLEKGWEEHVLKGRK
ncbi:MAG: ABC transporter substrate-binding protein [bacterium]|nr:ABC transporter substrate-binding protein [bacterium]